MTARSPTDGFQNEITQLDDKIFRTTDLTTTAIVPGAAPFLATQAQGLL